MPLNMSLEPAGSNNCESDDLLDSNVQSTYQSTWMRTCCLETVLQGLSVGEF
jgi:hypothetical protein